MNCHCIAYGSHMDKHPSLERRKNVNSVNTNPPSTLVLLCSTWFCEWVQSSLGSMRFALCQPATPVLLGAGTLIWTINSRHRCKLGCDLLQWGWADGRSGGELNITELRNAPAKGWALSFEVCVIICLFYASVLRLYALWTQGPSGHTFPCFQWLYAIGPWQALVSTWMTGGTGCR